MAKMWRVITAIVLVAILIGVVAGAVGFMTGADSARIYQRALNNETISQTRDHTLWAISQARGYALGAIDALKAFGETLIKLAGTWFGK